jgi:hypothetical protein
MLLGVKPGHACDRTAHVSDAPSLSSVVVISVQILKVLGLGLDHHHRLYGQLTNHVFCHYADDVTQH